MVSIEQECVELLQQHKWTVSTMESCTGGMLAARLLNVPGASDVFEAGYVTYSDKAKQINLGVDGKTLEQHTAVSAEVAKEMVEGRALQIKPDVALSTTGIAGPGGGTKEKPVGLVYIGCRVKETIHVERFCFSGNRAEVRQQATEKALYFMKQCVNQYFS